MPEKANFITKPCNKHMVHGHSREILPDDRLPEPLEKAV